MAGEQVALRPSEIRALAQSLGIRPTKRLGQNFVIDANVCRKIVRVAGVEERDLVLEIGPGLGSLTIVLLQAAGEVVAIEIDPVLAGALSQTITERLPEQAEHLTVINADAMQIKSLDGKEPTILVANLPYNISVPVLLLMLERFPSLRSGLVMVQSEVADRLAAKPGDKSYGIPSVKAAWWAKISLAGAVSRSVFWPVPNVDSGLVAFVRQEPPATSVSRQQVFAVIDAAFATRRKMLRPSLAHWAGSTAKSEALLVAAGVPPTARGEELALADFVAIASAKARIG
ncbi:MAG TPA: 16S rRNA (adenine(1518)-N(6)/adenine(1519)-N(6))-dimethyltransferase RsmA [Candidatus Nanopelagicaceae bacterium]|nr:16S rRNA (adenine(1518)-N(6)/adenine(1519)-N(6))-dimethyltransferase RsmA [Candidatus Nanopelagicaceae bacterium]